MQINVPKENIETLKRALRELLRVISEQTPAEEYEAARQFLFDLAKATCPIAAEKARERRKRHNDFLRRLGYRQ